MDLGRFPSTGPGSRTGPARMDRLAEIRELAKWEPAMGVLSVRLGFEPGDRARGWRTRLRNGVESVLAAAEEATPTHAMKGLLA